MKHSILPVCVALLLGCACPGSSPATGPAEAPSVSAEAATTATAAPSEPIVPRVYDVSGKAEMVLPVVRSILDADSNVTIVDGDTIVVTAPATIHTALEPVLAQVLERLSATPRSIAVDFWVVLGRAGEDEGPAPPALLAPALAAVEEQWGAMSFEVLDTHGLRALEGEESEGSNTVTEYKMRSASGEALLITDIEIQVHASEHKVHDRIRTRLSLTPDQVAVIGRSGTADGMLLYIAKPGVSIVQ